MTTQVPWSLSKDANEILPGLWLGNVNASKDDAFIRTNNINVIFNCTKTLPFNVNVEHKYRVPIDDNLEKEEIRNLALWAPEVAFKLFRHVRNGDRILVHCMAGMQRSAACIAIYLIFAKQCTPSEAISFIKSKRPIAFHTQANFKESIESFYVQYENEILPAIMNKQHTMQSL
jgi:protein tyrosine phosphatase